MTRHRFDPFSFLVGAVAVTVAALVLTGGLDLRTVDLRVVGPVVVLAAGIALLLGGRRSREEVGEPSSPSTSVADDAEVAAVAGDVDATDADLPDADLPDADPTDADDPSRATTQRIEREDR